MMAIFKSVIEFFKAEKTTYSHRDRTIEIIALEKALDIDLIKQETKKIIESEGSVEAIIKLRKRFHVTLSAAWRFVNKLDAG